MIDIADVRSLDLFDGLSDDQLAELLASGTEVPIVPGAALFQEGEPAEFWWVLVDGALDLLRRMGREEMVVARMDAPGRWAGGFRAWDEQGVYLASGRGSVPGRVLRVPASALRAHSDAWFPFAGHLIDGLFHTARSIEATARQRSSLLTLGTLAAGLAHEINNPASAAARSVEGLASASDSLLSSLSMLAAADMTAAQFVALDDLRKEVDPAAADLDPLAVADREEALMSWLDGHDVEVGWQVTSALAAAGVRPGWCDRAAAVIEGPALGPALKWAASTFSVASLLGEVQESTRRISELVAAVKSYSQVDRASLMRIDVTEGLESTLVVLGHKLRDGITVVRRYDPDLPQIEAYPGELNQVWTNLIDNAVDAMDGTGTLEVATHTDGDDVVVEIGDSGAGMPPEVVGRAFEAFFTTKDVGKGTGLGLDIARRVVVERHGGQIDIDSRPGATTLRVRLPPVPAASR